MLEGLDGAEEFVGGAAEAGGEGSGGDFHDFEAELRVLFFEGGESGFADLDES